MSWVFNKRALICKRSKLERFGKLEAFIQLDGNYYKSVFNETIQNCPVSPFFSVLKSLVISVFKTVKWEKLGTSNELAVESPGSKSR